MVRVWGREEIVERVKNKDGVGATYQRRKE